jgi:hypothetical protein
MRGMGHSDPIETVAFKHEEGNEGEKIGVKRRIGTFYGRKLLKRQGRWTDPAPIRRRRILQADRGPMRPDRPAENCRRDGASWQIVLSAIAHGHPPTLTKETHDSKFNFIDRRAIPRAEFVRCNCWVLDDKASRTTGRSCNRGFRSRPRLLSISGFPFLIPNLFRVQAELPQERTRHDCQSPHPDKRKERGSQCNDIVFGEAIGQPRGDSAECRSVRR